MDGTIAAVDQPGSKLFVGGAGGTAGALVGASLADSLDLFGDWRARGAQLELLLLALTGRASEMPGGQAQGEGERGGGPPRLWRAAQQHAYLFGRRQARRCASSPFLYLAAPDAWHAAAVHAGSSWRVRVRLPDAPGALPPIDAKAAAAARAAGTGHGHGRSAAMQVGQGGGRHDYCREGTGPTTSTSTRAPVHPDCASSPAAIVLWGSLH